MNILSTRDQENLIHAHQQAAAAKPLNQGVRGLAPKTPGNGNRGGLNGRMTVRGKGQGDENNVMGVRGKTGKTAKPTFITPLATRERAPLGAKTTNVKANAFKTPMPKTGGFGEQKTQKKASSARKHKLKVHQPEAVTAEPTIMSEDEEEFEIEYCFPSSKIISLPDFPDDNLAPIDLNDDFYSDSEKEEEKWRMEAGAKLDKEIDLACKQTSTFTDDELRFWGIEPEKTDLPRRAVTKDVRPTIQQSSTHKPSSAQSRAAASALSTKSQPRFAAPTAAAKNRKAAVLTSNPVTTNRRTATPGTIASRTTIGYAAGRRVSATMKQNREAPAAVTRKPSNPVITLKDLLDDDFDRDDHDSGDEEWDRKWSAENIIIPGIDDVKDFRLEMPGEV